jgi:hypothetical protein
LLNNPEQAFFDIPISGTRCSHGGNETFPGWGQNIPKLGNRLAASLVEENIMRFYWRYQWRRLALSTTFLL